MEGDGYRAEVSAEQARLANSQGGSLAEMHKVRRVSPREGTPPRGAKVLFNGTTSDAFEKAEMTGDGLLSAGALTKLAVQDFHLHLEFRTPYMPYAGIKEGAIAACTFSSDTRFRFWTRSA